MRSNIFKGPFLHRFNVIPDPETDEYIVMFPALVGCGVIVPNLEDIGRAALEEYQRWISERRGSGRPIPLSDISDLDPNVAPTMSSKLDA